MVHLINFYFLENRFENSTFLNITYLEKLCCVLSVVMAAVINVFLKYFGIYWIDMIFLIAQNKCVFLGLLYLTELCYMVKLKCYFCDFFLTSQQHWANKSPTRLDQNLILQKSLTEHIWQPCPMTSFGTSSRPWLPSKGQPLKCGL